MRFVLTAGRMDRAADLATAVWAFDILRYTEPGLELRVLGDGPERGRLERYARSAGREDDRVRFVREVDFAAAEQVWVTHHRGGGRLALAAMVHGRPVLAVDTPELRALLGEAAWYFPPGGRAALAALARKLLDCPANAAALGEIGRQRAAGYPGWQLDAATAAVYHEAGVPPPR
jgi:glycosyltransferase involved in cell wall biosynthesis